MWLVIFVVFVMVLALTQKNVRSSVVPLLKTLFASKLLVSFAIIIGYNAAVVWFLWQIGYWDASMLYDTWHSSPSVVLDRLPERHRGRAPTIGASI